MNVQRFVKWCETATSRQRAEGFVLLAKALFADRLPANEREAALTLLHLALDDPSPGVRRELAALIGSHPAAPRSLVNAFLADNDDIAVQVAGSETLTIDDLLQALAGAREYVQIAIAARRSLPAPVASALAWHGCLAACRTLLANESAFLSGAALRRLSDRFGSDADLRGRLVEHADLPPDVRQALMLETARALQSAPLLRHVLGAGRAGALVFRACERATAAIAEGIEEGGIAVFAEHLCATGQITPAFLIRSACLGNIELLAAALTLLSGVPERRVRALVVDGREGPFLHLMRNCGMPESAACLVAVAVRAWKDVVTRSPVEQGAADVEQVLQRIADVFDGKSGRAATGTMAMLRSLHGESRRDAMRARIEDLLAA